MELGTDGIQTAQKIPAVGESIDFGLVLIDVQVMLGDGEVNGSYLFFHRGLFVFEHGIGNATGRRNDGKANHPRQYGVTDAACVTRRGAVDA